MRKYFRCFFQVRDVVRLLEKHRAIGSHLTTANRTGDHRSRPSLAFFFLSRHRKLNPFHAQLEIKTVAVTFLFGLALSLTSKRNDIFQQQTGNSRRVHCHLETSKTSDAHAFTLLAIKLYRSLDQKHVSPR